MSAIKHRFLLAPILALSALSGCKSKPSAELAPSAAALSAEPTAASARQFSVDSASSKVTFLMDSPLEKIDGDASGGLLGDLFVDLSDLSKSSALVKVDLQKLVLYQRKRPDGQGAYGERTKSDLQNRHARNWLQIVAHEGDVTAEQAEANRFAEFKINGLESATPNDVASAAGSARHLTAIARGEFRLHGRKLVKPVKLELTVNYEALEPRSIHVKTREPLEIALEEFEVNPRDDAGKFVKSLSDALSSNLKGKVAQTAPLNLDFVAYAR